MSRIVLLTLLTLIAGGSYAQTYFVLIRSDNNQPFYVRIGDKTFSSSGQGHLIISQLKDSSYAITVGFPRKLFPEQQFSIIFNEKDLEFQLKDLGGKGWGLFNPQTLELKMPAKTDEAGARMHPDGVRKDDAFSRLMAGVVSDTAVMYNTYAMEEVRKNPAGPVAKDSSREFAGQHIKDPGKGDTVPLSATRIENGSASSVGQQARKDSTSFAQAALRNIPPAQTQRTDSAATPIFNPTPPSLNVSGLGGGSRAFVEKLSELRTGTAVRLMYSDHIPGSRADTILIIIPVDSPGRSTAVAATDAAKTGTDAAKTGSELAPKPKKTTPIVANSDCRNFAVSYDVDKLRLKLLATPKDEDKLLAATKVFRTKCFSTAQIRALSEVFASDAGKYKFLESAYPFVSDDHFRELADLLTDPAWSGRFRKMTGQ
ncbi:MAG TPA: DUF4476 domain-containing protein [Puia sp.]|nr:DUF4476 domain-containing protein [Puia sp.]